MSIKKYLDFTGLETYDRMIKSWTREQISQSSAGIKNIKIDGNSLPISDGAVTLSKVAETGSYEDLTNKTHGYIKSDVDLGSAVAVKSYVSTFFDSEANTQFRGTPVSFVVNQGYKYNVVYDGQEYNNIKCVGYPGFESYGVAKESVIGNTAMFFAEDSVFSELTQTFELPFLIYHQKLNSSYKVWLFTTTSGEHTISLTCTGYPNDSDTLDSEVDTETYEFTVTTGVSKQKTVEIPGQYPGWEHNNDFYANNNPLGSNVNACNLTTGKNLIVTFDGVDYNVTSYRYYDTQTYVSSGYGYTTYFVGNWKLNSLFAPLISTMSARGANHYDSIPDNTDDYPFCFSCTWGKPTGASATQMDNMLFATTAGNHTLSIKSTDGWAQLGPQYNQTEWDGGTFTLTGEVTSSVPAVYEIPKWYRGINNFYSYKNKDDQTVYVFETGKKVKVTLDNTDYNLTIQEQSSDTHYCGNPTIDSVISGAESTDEPFLLVGGLLYLPNSDIGQLKEISMSVEETQIQTLDSKFLNKDDIVSDWSEDDDSSYSFIKNKPTLSTVATTGSYSDLTNCPIQSSEWRLGNVYIVNYVPVQDREVRVNVEYKGSNYGVYTSPPNGTLVFVRVMYSENGQVWNTFTTEYITMTGSGTLVTVDKNTRHEGNLSVTDILGNSSYHYFRVSAMIIPNTMGGNNGSPLEIGERYFVVRADGSIQANNDGFVTGGQVYDYIASISESEVNELFNNI